MTTRDLILIKCIEQNGWQVSKTFLFDGHEFWTAKRPRGDGEVKSDTIGTLFELWLDHPMVLAKMVGVNIYEITEEQAREEAEKKHAGGQ